MSNINRANGTPPLMQYDALRTIALRNVIIVKYPYHPILVVLLKYSVNKHRYGGILKLLTGYGYTEC